MTWIWLSRMSDLNADALSGLCHYAFTTSKNDAGTYAQEASSSRKPGLSIIVTNTGLDGIPIDHAYCPSCQLQICVDRQ